MGDHRCGWQPADTCRGRGRACRRRPAACQQVIGAVPPDPRSPRAVSSDEPAVEETFVNKNPASPLKLGVARGVVLLAPAERGLPVAEYSANMVKKSVVGAGHAGKEQVQLMVRRLLPGCTIVEPDAADALAVAICHAHHAGTVRAWQTPAPEAAGAHPAGSRIAGSRSARNPSARNPSARNPSAR